MLRCPFLSERQRQRLRRTYDWGHYIAHGSPVRRLVLRDIEQSLLLLLWLGLFYLKHLPCHHEATR